MNAIEQAAGSILLDLHGTMIDGIPAATRSLNRTPENEDHPSLANATVMVENSENDILAAQDAGVASICVRFGYCHAPLEKLNPTELIDAAPARVAESRTPA